LQLGVDYTVAIMGLLCLGLMQFFKIKGREWEAGIVSGFTIYAVCEISALVSQYVFGTRFKTAREWLPAIAYIVAAIEWVVALSRPEYKVSRPRDLTVDDLAQLDEYSESLARFLGRKS